MSTYVALLRGWTFVRVQQEANAAPHQHEHQKLVTCPFDEHDGGTVDLLLDAHGDDRIASNHAAEEDAEVTLLGPGWVRGF